MRKLLLAIILTITAPTAFAGGGHHGGGHHGHHGYRHHGYHSYNWVAPAVIGGLLVYGATRPYYYSEPVYTPPPMSLGPALVRPITPVAYWCPTEGGYFPQVQSCFDWQVVTQ